LKIFIAQSLRLHAYHFGTTTTTTTTTTTVLQPFVRDYPGESVTILDFAEADMMEWQWHQPDHMQAICTLLQKITMPAPHQSDFYGLDTFLTPNQQCQSTEGSTTLGQLSVIS